MVYWCFLSQLELLNLIQKVIIKQTIEKKNSQTISFSGFISELVKLRLKKTPTVYPLHTQWFIQSTNLAKHNSRKVLKYHGSLTCVAMQSREFISAQANVAVIDHHGETKAAVQTRLTYTWVCGPIRIRFGSISVYTQKEERKESLKQEKQWIVKRGKQSIVNRRRKWNFF